MTFLFGLATASPDSRRFPSLTDAAMLFEAILALRL